MFPFKQEKLIQTNEIILTACLYELLYIFLKTQITFFQTTHTISRKEVCEQSCASFKGHKMFHTLKCKHKNLISVNKTATFYILLQNKQIKKCMKN